MARLLAMTLAVTGFLMAAASADPGPDSSQAPPAPARSEPWNVLATGDSMVLYLADSLVRQLGEEPEAKVRTDARSGSGISKSFLFSWPGYAASQARLFRPAATVVFLGASDGFPLTARSGRRVSCCARPWRQEYARRARLMMQAYSRRGDAYVYWLLLPHPRPSLSLGRSGITRRRIFMAVNAAVGHAARGMGDTVRLVPLNEVFTPHGRYSDTIVWRGRRVPVRAGDGIHLSEDGAAIAASLVVKRMQSDGLLMGH